MKTSKNFKIIEMTHSNRFTSRVKRSSYEFMLNSVTDDFWNSQKYPDENKIKKTIVIALDDSEYNGEDGDFFGEVVFELGENDLVNK